MIQFQGIWSYALRVEMTKKLSAHFLNETADQIENPAGHDRFREHQIIRALSHSCCARHIVREAQSELAERRTDWQSLPSPSRIACGTTSGHRISEPLARDPSAFVCGAKPQSSVKPVGSGSAWTDS